MYIGKRGSILISCKESCAILSYSCCVSVMDSPASLWKLSFASEQELIIPTTHRVKIKKLFHYFIF